MNPDLESQIVRILDESDADPAVLLDALAAAHPDQAAEIREFLDDFVRAHAPQATETPPADLAQIGGYRILERLGAGGMGTVYRAEDTALGRQVALKVLRPHFLHDAAIRKRFEREVRAASRLDHPNICRVYEVGEADGEPYMAMQLVDGESLAERLHRAAPAHETAPASGSSGPQRREHLLDDVKLIEDAARAIHVAHDAGLVHRDIKPGNLMVTPGREIVVLDFGLVHDNSERQPAITLTGELLGTPRYMAPEQVVPQGREVDRRTDVYALGVTLYELLTHVPPFASDTRAELFDAIRRSDPIAPRRHNRAIPKDLQVVIARAMDPDPERRYLTAAAFADDLRRVRQYEPIAARPAGRALRAYRWCQRNRVAAVGLSGLAIALLITTWLGQGWKSALARERSAHAAVAQARAAERQEAAARHFGSAAAAVERGDYAAALIAFRHARSSGFDDDIAVSLGIVDSNEALSQVGESAELLTALAARTDDALGRHAARVRLLDGYSKLTVDDAAVRTQVERALRLDAASPQPGLSDADREFAHAMLAADLAALLTHLERARAADPRHYLSLMQLGLARLAAGEPEQTLELSASMRLLVPSTWNHVGLEVVALAVLNRMSEARSVLTADERLPEDLQVGLSLVIDVFEVAHDHVDDNMRRRVAAQPATPATSTPLKWAAIVAKVLQLQATARRLGDADSTYRLRVPPQIWQPYAALVPLLPQLLLGGVPKLVQVVERRAAAGTELGSAALYLLLARTHLANQQSEPASSYGRFLHTLDQGRHSGGFAWGMPTVRRLFGYDTCAALVSLAHYEEPPNDERRRRLAVELQSATRLEGTTEPEFAHYAHFASQATDREIVLDGVIERWKSAHPASPRPWVLQAQTRLAQGATQLAASYCRRALQLDPGDEHAIELLELCK